ncbi:MAG: hypothetical protein WC278_00670 [Bacilli bacterium]
MFDLLIFVLINSFWITLIIGTLTLFGMRLYQVITTKQTFRDALMILFVPCSIGYYLYFKKKTAFKKVYQIFVVIFFVTALLASIFMIYIKLGGGML